MNIAMKLITSVAGFALGLGLTAQATPYTTDFTTATAAGLTEGGSLSSTATWNAQPAWTTTDVSGSGYALVGTTFSRAINTGGGTTMAVGDSITLSLNLNVLGNWDEGGGDNNLLSVGLTEDFDPGTALTRVGAGIRANTFAETLNLRDHLFSASPNEVALNWENINDTSATISDNLGWVVTITKSATLNTFDVSTTITDAEGANQGAGNVDFSIVSSELYSAGSIYPILRGGTSLPGNDITGLQIDTFSATSNVVPEPSTLAFFLFGGMMVWYRRLRVC